MPAFSFVNPAHDQDGVHAPCAALCMPRAARAGYACQCTRAMQHACPAGQSRRALPGKPGFFPVARDAAGLCLNGAPRFAEQRP